MEKVIITTRSVDTDEGVHLDLEYALLTRPGTGADSYGIAVTLRRDGREESASAADISPVGSTVLALIERLADGFVTPVSLLEVLLELLP